MLVRKKSHKLITKVLQKDLFSYNLNLYRFDFCWHSAIILIGIAYIGIDLNFKVLADKFSELGFFLTFVSLVYNRLNISLGLKIQHDLQGANFSLDCPKGIDTVSVPSVCSHMPASWRQVQQKHVWCRAVPLLPPSPASGLTWAVPAESKAAAEKHREITLH